MACCTAAPSANQVLLRFDDFEAVLPATSPIFRKAHLVLHRNSKKFIIDGRGAMVTKLPDGRKRINWTSCVGVYFTASTGKPVGDKKIQFQLELFADDDGKVKGEFATRTSNLFAMQSLLASIVKDAKNSHPRVQQWRDEPFGDGGTISFAAFQSTDDEVLDELLSGVLGMMRHADFVKRVPITQVYTVDLLDALRESIAEARTRNIAMTAEARTAIETTIANVREVRRMLMSRLKKMATDRVGAFVLTANGLFRLVTNMRHRRPEGDRFPWPEAVHAAYVAAARGEIDDLNPIPEEPEGVEEFATDVLDLSEIVDLSEAGSHLQPLRSALLVPQILGLLEEIGPCGRLLFGAIRAIFRGLVAMKSVDRSSRIISARCCLLLQIVQDQGVRKTILEHDATRAALLNLYAAIDECREIIEDFNQWSAIRKFVQATAAAEELQTQADHLTAHFTELHQMVSLRAIGKAAKVRDEAVANIASSQADAMCDIVHQAVSDLKKDLLAQQATLVAACADEVSTSGPMTLLRQRVDDIISQLDNKPGDDKSVVNAKLDKLFQASADTASGVAQIATTLCVEVGKLNDAAMTVQRVVQDQGQMLLSHLQMQDDQLAALLRATGASKKMMRDVAGTVKDTKDAVDAVMAQVKRGEEENKRHRDQILSAMELMKHEIIDAINNQPLRPGAGLSRPTSLKTYTAGELRTELGRYYQREFRHMSLTSITRIDFSNTFCMSLLGAGSDQVAATEHIKCTPADLLVLCTRLQKTTVLIQGQAGLGKSTLAKYVAREQLSMLLLHRTIGEHFFVIFVQLSSLRTYVDENPSSGPIDFALLVRVAFPDLNGRHAQTNLTADDIIRSLQTNTESLRILWLLDGFDEISASQNTRLQAFFNTFVSDARVNRGRDIVVVTSREERSTQLYLDDNFKSLLRLELLPWDRDTVEQFVRGYFKAHRDLPQFRSASYLVENPETFRCPAANSVFATLDANTLTTWAGVPMLYEMLCCQSLTHDGSVPGTTSPTVLLADVVRDLVRREQRKKQSGANQTDAMFTACVAMAEDRAWELHVGKAGQVEFTLDLASELEAEKRETMELLCQSLCTFRPHLTRSETFICTFVHKMFEEYFIASRLHRLVQRGKIDKARRALRFTAESHVMITLLCHLARDDVTTRAPVIKMLREAFFNCYWPLKGDFTKICVRAEKTVKLTADTALLTLQQRREWIERTNVKTLVAVATVLGDPTILNPSSFYLKAPRYGYLLLEPAAASGSIEVLQKALEFNKDCHDVCYRRQCLILAMETSSVFGTDELMARLMDVHNGVVPTLVEAAHVKCTAVVRKLLNTMSFHESKSEIVKCGQIACDVDDQPTVQCVLDAARQDSSEALRFTVACFVRRVLDTGRTNKAASSVSRFAETIVISGNLWPLRLSSCDLVASPRWRFDSTWSYTKTIALHDIPGYVTILSFESANTVERVTISSCAGVMALQVCAMERLTEFSISACPLLNTFDISTAVAENLLVFRIRNCYRVSREGLARALLSAKRVRYLQVQGCSCLGPQDLPGAPRALWGNARELNFGDVPAMHHQFLDRLTALPHLAILSVVGSPVVNGAILQNFVNITSLDVSRCVNVDDAAISVLQNLKVLRASGCLGVSAKAWNGFLSGAHSLEELDVSCTFLGYGTTIVNLPNTITKINASRCEFPSASVLLPCGRALRELDLSDTLVDDATLVPVLREAKKLVRLNISRCRRVTAVVIAVALTSSAPLAELGAESCSAVGFWPKSIKTPAAGSCSFLESVTMSNCPLLRDDTMLAILNAAPRLQRVDVRCCSALTVNIIRAIARLSLVTTALVDAIPSTKSDVDGILACPKLTRLSCADAEFSAGALCTAVTRRALQCICIDDCTAATDDDVAGAADWQALSGLSGFSAVRSGVRLLSGADIPKILGTAVHIDASGLPHLPSDLAAAVNRVCDVVTVRSLSLARTGVRSLPALPAITSFDVSECGVMDQHQLLAALDTARGLVSFRALNCAAVTDTSIEGLLRKCPDLEEVLIGDNSCLTAAGIEAALRSPVAVKLTAVDISNTGAASSTVATIAKSAPQLHRLNLARCGDITDLTSLHECPLLAELDIRECFALRPATIKTAIEPLRQLAAFHAQGVPACDTAVLAALATLPALQYVTLSRCQPFSDAQLAVIATRGLQSLGIAATLAGPRTLLAICTNTFGCLQELDVSRCRAFDDTALETLVSTGTIALRALDISSCERITGMGLGAALACATLVKLVARELRNVRDVCLPRGTESLRTAQRPLEHLDVRGCIHVTPTIVSRVGDAPRLSFIDVGGCGGLDDTILRMAPRRLHTMRAHGCNVTSHNLRQWFLGGTHDSSSKGPSLIELDVSGVGGVTAEALSALCGGPSQTTLRVLKTQDCLALKDVQSLASMLSLTELDLSGSGKVSTGSIQACFSDQSTLATTLRSFRLLRYRYVGSLRLGALFASCRSLTELAIGAPDSEKKWTVTQDVVRHFAFSLTSLRVLALHNATGWSSAAEALSSGDRRRFRCLSTLDVRGCSTADLGAIAVSLAFGCSALTSFSCPGRDPLGSTLGPFLASRGNQLRSLDLSQRPDVDAATLEVLYRRTPHLAELQLNGCGLAAAAAIPRLPEKFPRLAVLGVDCSNVMNRSDVARFIAAAPCIRTITGLRDLSAELIDQYPHVAFSR
jgi:hypothetical protein